MVEARPPMQCSGCGAMNVGVQANCLLCQAPLPRQTAPEVAPAMAAAATHPAPLASSSVAPPSFCTQCGNALTPGKRFCTRCGHRVEE